MVIFGLANPIGICLRAAQIARNVVSLAHADRRTTVLVYALRAQVIWSFCYSSHRQLLLPLPTDDLPIRKPMPKARAPTVNASPVEVYG